MMCLLLISTIASSCKMDEIAATEATKKIQGSWHVAKATRNGTDITEKFDFKAFRITFGEDGHYQLEYPLPFIVSANGTYSLDDPQYPFQIQFKEDQNGREANSSFDYPIVEEGRNLNLTFSTGCSSNTYIYTLEKLTDQ